MLNLLNQTTNAYDLPSTLQGFDFNPNIRLRGELASIVDSKITGYRAASYAEGFLSDYIPTTAEIKQVLQTLPSGVPITVIISDGLGKTTFTRHQLSASGEFKISVFDNVEDAYAPQQSVADANIFDVVTPFSEILEALKSNSQGAFNFLPQGEVPSAFIYSGGDLVESKVVNPIPFAEVEIIDSAKVFPTSGVAQFGTQPIENQPAVVGNVPFAEVEIIDPTKAFPTSSVAYFGTQPIENQPAVVGNVPFVEVEIIDPTKAFPTASSTVQFGAVQPIENQPAVVKAVPFAEVEIIDPTKSFSTSSMVQFGTQPFEHQSAVVGNVPFAEVEIIDPTKAFPTGQALRVQSAAFNALPFAEVEILDPTKSFPTAKASQTEEAQFISLTNLQLDWI